MEQEVKSPIVRSACGCLILTIAKRMRGNKTNLSGFEIKHCPLHKAAPDLLEACKRLRRRAETGKAVTQGDVDTLDAALAKAKN